MNLKESYNKESFIEYIGDFIPGFSKDVRPADFSSPLKTIKGATYLGHSEELELSVFELKTTGSNDKKLSQARDGFRIMKEYHSYRALMVYYSEDDKNWRLSLMQMTPDLNEKGKIITKISNPRRYSFYLGVDAKTKTADNFLIKKGVVKDFDDLLDRFNVEIVTKEFYQHYRKLFLNLLEYLESDKAFNAFAVKHGLKMEIFAKKLLGQIIFIYFLQKKGWLGAKKGEYISNGDRNFLRNLFEKCQRNGESFFNDYLEYLFYDCLNKLPERSGSFYRTRLDCQIPFLNGGLFEPINDYNWKDEFTNIPNEIFSSKDESGILDIFDLYNFTIDENTPDDQEVSVDPEMLGKVFENLIEDNIRKGQGAFYTPREIVFYMCQESLVSYIVSNHSNITEENIRNYIFYSESFENFKDQGGESFVVGQWKEIDNLLKEIKVCDPACGSGAFLVGMLNVILKLRIFLQTTPDHKQIAQKDRYELKKEIIQNCLYGVDIDAGAVDIAKLRFWLSIVVEEEVDEIEPLPNLDYKIMQGNSLLENLVIGDSVIKLNFNGNKRIDGRTKEQKELFHIAGVQGKLILEESDTLADKLEQYHSEYFSVNDPEKKKILKKKIDNIEDELIQSKCQEEIKNAEHFIQNNFRDGNKILKNTEKILAVKKVLNTWKVEHLRPFFPWRLHFSEVFNRENSGFDIIIANPPYIKEYTQKSAFDGLRELPYYQGKMDLWYFFVCEGIDFLKNDTGILAIIAQNNWTTSYGASILRNKVLNDTQILNLIDFGNYKIFESAGIQTMVMIFKKNINNKIYNFDFRRLIGQNLKFEDVTAVLNKFQDKKAEYLKPKIIREELLNKGLTFNNSEINPILEKITEKKNFQLDKKVEVAQGIVCPQDKINKASQVKLGINFNIGDGIFVLDNLEKKDIGFTKKELNIIKPVYTTKELFRWYGNKNNKEWVIYTDSSFRDKKKIESYPNIKKHLDQFSKVITSDNKPYGLHRARDERFFTGEKIIVARKCIDPTFSFIDFDSYVSATFYVIKTERLNQKYLVALLNSRLIAFWLRHKGKMQGSNYQIDKEPLINLPLIMPSVSDQKPFIKLVDNILAITRSDDYSDNKDKQAKVKEYENQIDEMVYDLYKLSPEEIKVINNN